MSNMSRWLCVTWILVFIQALGGVCRLARAQGQSITFSATGDVPYGSSQVSVFQKQLDNHNRYSPSAFFVHVGDIFRGGEPCGESPYSFVASMLQGLAVPVFITPGDNETINCSSPSQGFDNWLKSFENFEQNFCGSKALSGAPEVERQSVRPENLAFTVDGVLFIGINLVYGGSSGKQQAADWVKQQLQAKVSQVRAAVIFSHYGPDKSSTFSTPFRQAAAAFGKPILFLHGHGHEWVMDRPFPEENILRVQVDNGSAEDPVQVTVTTDPEDMFTFKRNPWSSKVVYNMPPCVDAGPDQTLTLSPTTTLNGGASDDGDPDPPGALTYTWSVVSGPGVVSFGNANALVTTASFSAMGTYVLRLNANDGQLEASDEVMIVVNTEGPIISSFSPTSGPVGTQVTIAGSNFTGANAVTFNSASGGTTASFTVNSDIQILATVPDGAITGKISVTKSASTGLSADDFVVTTDTGGGSGSEFTFNPTDDAYIRSASATSNFGSATELRVERETASDETYTYMKFNVSGLGETVQSARIRLQVTNSGTQGGSIFSVSNNYQDNSSAWTEGGIIWNNAPAVSGSALSTLGSVSAGQTVEFDVTAAITGNGIYSFALKNNSTNLVAYSSKEGSISPTLIIQATPGLLPAPTIASFTPVSGAVETEVTITGSHFTGTTNVTFNGNAATFFVDSDDRIRATVPAGATTGKIGVTNSAGSTFSADNFTVTFPPTVTSFTPRDGGVGTEVTITGSDFTGATGVAFNGMDAIFTVNSDTEIHTTVPDGATTGKISVTNSVGASISMDDFIVTTSGGAGELTFNPTDDAYVRSALATSSFGSATELRVERETASDETYTYLKFNISGLGGFVQSAKIRLQVTNSGTQGGSIFWVSNNYQDNSSAWTEGGIIWNNAPAISGSALSTLGSVSAGQSVEIDVTAAITGNGIYSFALKNNSTNLVAYSSKEGSTKPELIILTTSAPPATPTIASFTPASGPVGSEVTITGSNFTGTTGVTFNGMTATFTVISDAEIRATVPDGATKGKISVTNGVGTGVSASDFTVTFAPTVTSFTPSNGPVGMDVTIAGSNFTGATGVAFNGVTATFNVISDTEIHATVPEGATTGKISVTNSVGTGASTSDFTVTATPAIASFAPASGPAGTEVTITGSHFTGTTRVTFNGTGATFFVDSDLRIRANVPAGATTGQISVTNSAGSAISADIFTVTAPSLLTFTFAPLHDTYVKSSSPASSYGSGSSLRQEVNSSSDICNTYLKFELTGLSGMVQSAKLRLYVTNASNDGGSVYLVSNNYQGSTTPWIESGLSWNNAPGISGTALSTAGTVSLSTWIELEVAPTIVGNGIYSFGLKNNSSDAVTYGSKETANAPQLIIETTPSAAPSIASFTPAAGSVGTEVTITGSNFSGTTGVAFNGSVASFVVISDVQIRATVPDGATTGKITVTNTEGTGSHAADFMVMAPPEIASFTPAEGAKGVEVTITGSHFTGTTGVTFNGVLTNNFTVDSDAQIRAQVPAGATPGKIGITNPAGSAFSATDFIALPTFSFAPVHDAYVKSSSPTNNYGSSSSLRQRISSSEIFYTYLKFEVTGLAGAIRSAKLRLYVTDASPDGGAVYLVSNDYKDTATPWIESELKWDNAPAIDGTALSAAGEVSVGTWVELEVTPAIVGNGIYSFGLKNNVSNLVYYSSKEGANSPELVIVMTSGSGTAAKRAGMTPTPDASEHEKLTTPPPDHITLYPNHPNPFNAQTTIEYALPAEAKVRLFIFNVNGQPIRKLVDGIQPAGHRRVVWDGKDHRGVEVSSGIYLYRLEAGGKIFMRQLTVLK